MTIKDAKHRIAEIVQRWHDLTTSQLREYNEENTKNVFIQPLFEALGWDFHDLSQVTAEHRAGGGRVDFAFRVKGVSQFYLEAKPLRDELAAHQEWAKRAKSYAYNKGIPWAVLTNFKDLWVLTGDATPTRFITLSANDAILAPYLSYSLNSVVGQRQFDKTQYGQTRPGLNLTNIAAIVVPVPDDQERDMITGMIDTVRLRLREEQAVLMALHKAKSSVVDALLSGRVRLGGGSGD